MTGLTIKYPHGNKSCHPIELYWPNLWANTREEKEFKSLHLGDDDNDGEVEKEDEEGDEKGVKEEDEEEDNDGKVEKEHNHQKSLGLGLRAPLVRPATSHSFMILSTSYSSFYISYFRTHILWPYSNLLHTHRFIYPIFIILFSEGGVFPTASQHRAYMHHCWRIVNVCLIFAQEGSVSRNIVPWAVFLNPLPG